MKKTAVPSQTIDQIINSAILAPSSHNTQPWLFSVENDQLFFFVDKTRALQIADPTNRELYVSIGCSIANALVEANNQGLKVKLTLFPKKNNKIFVAQMHFEKSDQENKYAYLQPFIKNRLSNRFDYQKGRSIPSEFVLKCKKMVKEFDTDFEFVDQVSGKEKLAKLTREAIFKAISNPEFRNELTHWIRHNWTKKTDGMPGYATGLPGVMSLLFPALIHSPTMPKMVSEGEYAMVKNSAAVGILSIKEDSVEEWVKAGIALELIWLQATHDAISFSLLSGAVEYEEERAEVKKLLKSKLYPSVFFRMGYATITARPSPRRSKDDVLRPLQQLQLIT